MPPRSPTGAASGAVFAQVDASFPDWLNGAAKQASQPTMISAERLLGQAERIVVRGTVSAGIAYLEGGKTRVAFWKSVEFDGLSLAQRGAARQLPGL